MKQVEEKADIEKHNISTNLKFVFLGIFKLFLMYMLYGVVSSIPEFALMTETGGVSLGEEIALSFMILAGLAGFIVYAKKSGLAEWKWRNLTQYKYWLILLIVLNELWSNLIFKVYAFFHITVSSINERNIDVMSAKLPALIMFVTTVMLAPVCEELLFRAAFFKWLAPHRRKLMFVFSVLLFAFAHVQTEPGNWAAWLVYLGPALFYSFIYYKTDKVEGSILAHSIGNLVAFLGL